MNDDITFDIEYTYDNKVYNYIANKKTIAHIFKYGRWPSMDSYLDNDTQICSDNILIIKKLI